MEELKKLLLQADDEYLTGLSNRGTVKRGYKDLEQETPEAVWSEEEAQVTWKEASCQIRVLLGAPAAVPHAACAAIGLGQWFFCGGSWRKRAVSGRIRREKLCQSQRLQPRQLLRPSQPLRLRRLLCSALPWNRSFWHSRWPNSGKRREPGPARHFQPA